MDVLDDRRVSYVELHCHSCFSFREGASTPLELVLQAQKLGYESLALTDHDNLAGAMEFARTAKAWGLRPITGAEITVRSGSGAAPLPALSPRGRGRSAGGDSGRVREGTGRREEVGRTSVRPSEEESQGVERARGSAPLRVEGLGHPGLKAGAWEREGGRTGSASTEGEILRFAQNDRQRSESDRQAGSPEQTYHLTLLAETAVGYANLSRMLTEANLSNVRGRPVVSFESLARQSEGLIALSGCRKGEVPSRVEAGELRAAREAADRLRSVFGREGFFLELQDNLSFTDQPRNEDLVRIAADLGLGCVATNNVHYHVRERHRLHDVLVAVRERSTLDDVRPLLRPNSEHYLKSASEMERLFAEMPEAIENSGRIAERCVFDLTRDLSYRFPDYVAPDPGPGQERLSGDEFLEALCLRRGRELYRSRWREIEPRVRDELRLIREGKRAGFFLRLWELLQTAHEHDLPVRGRGSSVGSVVCYLLGLSGIDPLRYDLFVGRFLNEARLEEDVPDIDLDFGRDAREKMFETIFTRYTTAHAAQVCNFIEYRYPSAIRDVGKALGLPPGDIDKVAKRMHSRFAGGLVEELGTMPEFASRLKGQAWRDFLTLVEELRGMPRHLSQHSGGVILSTTRVDEQVPVERPAMEGRYICQWDKDSVADAGMIKLDLLAYPTLDQLYRGLRYVWERHGRRVSPDVIPLDDPSVYEMIRDGDVIGIVQIQSRAQIQVLLRINISTIHDLVIQVALIRPGPIQGGAVNPYIARCLGQEPVTYDHPSLEPVLAETKGVFIFQEQVLQAAMAIAGFTPGQAEMLRRAMSRKRSREAMEALREDFLAGARRNGIAEKTAETVYEKILAFAEFGFPKSHAAAMAETAYKVAWLKRYYPLEFYCALLNEQPMGFYSEEVICNDARRHGIEVLPVEVNHSRKECVIEGEAIRLGYRNVKGLGEAAWERLEEEAGNGEYGSLWDFWRRTRLSREAIENLIRLGAFTFTGLHERELIWQLGAFYQPLGASRPLQLSFDDGAVSLPEMSKEDRIVTDLLLTGISVRGRAMDLLAPHLHEGISPSNMVQEMAEGTPVKVAGLVAVRQAPMTAKGFVFHTLEDYFGHVNVITRPGLVKKYRRLIEGAPALIVHGHIERQERAVNVIAEHFEEAPAVGVVSAHRVHSFG